MRLILLNEHFFFVAASIPVSHGIPTHHLNHQNTKAKLKDNSMLFLKMNGTPPTIPWYGRNHSNPSTPVANKFTTSTRLFLSHFHWIWLSVLLLSAVRLPLFCFFVAFFACFSFFVVGGAESFDNGTQEEIKAQLNLLPFCFRVQS